VAKVDPRRRKFVYLRVRLFLERDEQNCDGFALASRSQLRESITFMILDRIDPKS